MFFLFVFNFNFWYSLILQITGILNTQFQFNDLENTLLVLTKISPLFADDLQYTFSNVLIYYLFHNCCIID